MMLGSDKGDVSVAGKLAKETDCDVWVLVLSALY